MKKTDWTDRMLAALVELYPVETTAYTAAVLNLSESTVKLKARELGLVKMAKSKWMERADYIRNHIQECSFSEIGKALGITRMSVGRIAAALGLKRSSEEKHLISSRIRTQMVKRERRRIVFGLEPVTGIRVISNRAKVRVRSNMKSNGYIISEEHNVIYYTGTTERRECLESRGIRLGLHILPLPEDSSALSSNIILQQPCSTDR
ncbi:MarR family transcriptional regulator [Bacteroides uniformis]|uniref:MarR family transcriptional regulator n=1 Tax=Bacteroides uniformis TaxID=820 RepID=UPI00186411EA